MRSPLRILDANLNRAREAARVMEEAARFLLDDSGVAGDLKALRHELTAAATALPLALSDRDTPADVGTALSTRGERTRTDVRGVVAAAGKRLGEALRTLEEYGKLADPTGPAPGGTAAAPDRDAPFSTVMKSLRYRGYELERRLLDRLAVGSARQWRVCVLVTESLCTERSWEQVVESALDGGADAIQLREKSLGDRELLRRARRLVALCRGRAAAIVNDRPDVALLAAADGVHLGSDDLPVADARRLAGERLVVGASTHDLAEAQQAIRDGADCCGVGAMFASATKPRAVAGVEYLRAFLAAHPDVPHLAIGGIGPDNVATLAAAGCRGVAVSAAVCGAARPDEVVRALRAALP